LQRGVEIRKGSINDLQSLIEASKGCSGIFHLAGVVIHSRFANSKEECYATNVDGTLNVMKAAQRNRCRVVYASTSGVVGCNSDQKVIANDRSDYCIEVFGRWPYYMSKYESELQSIKFAKENNVELVIMRPAMIVGPGDTKFRSTSTVVKFIDRHLPCYPYGGICFVDVRDVALAFYKAMIKGRNLQTYLLGAVNCSLHEFFCMLEKVSGVAKPKVGVPVFIIGSIVYTWDTFLGMIQKSWKLFGIDPVQWEMAIKSWSIDCSAAREDLDFNPREPESTLRDTIHWITENRARFPGIGTVSKL